MGTAYDAISSRRKESSTALSFVNRPQTLTVPCSLFSNLNR
ncbi:hypothetical protein MC7420_4800 [Coleofasciculus chthonoplastes PCC 7420]|uniref:Uncharacterized protein n=1 Tax=Coleofasciculus chthonoplastes PCC 7420 TaxID=118168 RepID=B4VP64_9CYAN|nr:hypothetical protein MC7420_4800 [Coleofasciculus chthonoplastes PCC 7420]